MEDNNLLAHNAIQLAASTTLVHAQPVSKAKPCIACRKRKVKCDRDVPCSNCARWLIDCVYPSPIRTCARPRKLPSQAPATQAGFDSLYSSGISVLESRIAQLTAALDMQNSRLQAFFPSAGTAQACWRVFLETVNPLVKVLYRPHAYGVLQRITQARTPHAARDSEHALALAIYLACISAMKEAAVQVHFQMTKTTGIATLRSATERVTAGGTTLQALVLFISLSIYQREQKSAWTLAGPARRLDYAPGKGRSLFDAVMRRRLWWQRWYLDHRAAEDYRGKEAGSSDPDAAPAQGSMALPLNCCDAELHPNMTRLPVPQPAWTEVSFSLIRFDIAYTRRFVESNQP
ncbi:putative Zn(II)2Cys6 transcription factor [Aspergillus terreus]|uniref:Putative Zn(II)2Cys6 transcription factor n=1 Tax=Aspergillus terreus TaxID=33178 RepID=A0A5M3YZK8_ASPTE|nr:hypothetical protein ATETN484_0004063300 [Aspergillus terreus]GFF13526.1 putative Zn(II)2Cys6 transcription factor [Aspergillus terreus]